MSIEIKIPKEINQYEAKAVGPFTLRQFFSLAACLPFCIGLFLLTKPYIGVDMAGFVAMVPGGVAYLFGWCKPYGMRFEVYMKTTFVNAFLAPRKRLYKTENFYADLLNQIEQETAEEAAASDVRKRSGRNQKYKRSKLAIK